MLEVKFLTKFKKDLKRLKKQGKNMTRLKDIIRLLAEEKELPPSCHDHALSGNWKDFRDCHIEPDWMLIYQRNNEVLTLILARTGSHSELEL